MNNPSFITMVVGLFAMTGPIAGLPIFVAATHGQSVTEQRKTTLILTVTYITASFIALFAGNALLAFFGISVAALRAAGMAVIATIGWKMLNAPTPVKNINDKIIVPGVIHEKKPVGEALIHTASNTKIGITGPVLEKHTPSPSEIGIVPLGFPIYGGPGVLSVIITWSSESHSLYVAAIGAILINAALIVLLNFLAQPITRIVGVQGLLVTEKIFGLIVLAIAVAGMASALLILFPGLGAKSG